MATSIAADELFDDESVVLVAKLSELTVKNQHYDQIQAHFISPTFGQIHKNVLF